MNFYKHHIGDYAQATAHLSFVEDAAYSRMLRKYYAEEAPLPVDVAKVIRLIGARTREEKQAVQTILDEFFTLEADGWHNKRADEELARAGAQAETNRRIAEEREARKRARIVELQSTNRATDRSDDKHDSLDDSFASREPSQTPDSRLQTPELPPTPFADATGEHATNGHDSIELVGKARREKRPAKRAMPEGWTPNDATIAWVNRFLAEHGLSEEWAQRQHELFVTKAKARGWVYVDWDRAYEGFFRENGPGGRFAA